MTDDELKVFQNFLDGLPGDTLEMKLAYAALNGKSAFFPLKLRGVVRLVDVEIRRLAAKCEQLGESCESV